MRIMSKQFTFDPKLDFAIERFIDAPTRLVWEALTWKSFRCSDSSGPPCCSPDIARLSLTTFRSPPS
jgi:hypothetical protein